MSLLETSQDKVLYVGNKLLSNEAIVIATFNSEEEANISSDNCVKAIQLAQIKKLIKEFERNPKYYVEWEGKRSANGGYWVFGAQKLINEIKKIVE
jgi:hypothetical protein